MLSRHCTWQGELFLFLFLFVLFCVCFCFCFCFVLFFLFGGVVLFFWPRCICEYFRCKFNVQYLIYLIILSETQGTEYTLWMTFLMNLTYLDFCQNTISKKKDMITVYYAFVTFAYFRQHTIFFHICSFKRWLLVIYLKLESPNLILPFSTYCCEASISFNSSRSICFFISNNFLNKIYTSIKIYKTLLCRYINCSSFYFVGTGV